MSTDFSIEYSQRSDDELLHLASERHSLPMEAVAALDAELRRRNLTESDRAEYQQFVRRQERREGRRRHWKITGLKNRMTWRDILEAFAAMALISLAYFALPSRYRFIKPDWQEAAVIVTITSVILVFVFRTWRTIAFWMSLGISSAIHLVAVHALTMRIPTLNRGEARGAGVLGFVLFLVVYGVVRFLQRMMFSKQTPDPA